MGTVSGRPVAANSGSDRRIPLRAGHLPQPQGLGQLLLRKLGGLAVACAAFLIGFTFFGNEVPVADAESTASSEVLTQPAAVAQLVEKFDCWSGAAPADMEGKVPGHVIVTRAGAERPVRGGAVLVGQALDQIFAGTQHGLQVHAFCR